MKRSQFLATICALFTAPFIGKSKENTVNRGTKEDVDRILAPYRDATIPTPDLHNSAATQYWDIKESDIRMIIENEERRRGRIK